MSRRHQALLTAAPWPVVNSTITTISRDRTIVVRESSAYGVLLPIRPLRWPEKLAGEVLDYSLDISRKLRDTRDRISSVHVSMSPCDALPPAASAQSFTLAYGVPNYWQPKQPINEAKPVAVGAQRGVVTAWIAGGVPGRPSQVKISVHTFGGRRLQFLVDIQTGAEWNGCIPASPYSVSFCEPTIWETPRAKLNRPSNSLYTALL